MRLVRRIFLAISFLLLAAGLVAAVALPGPQHILCPSCHGLEKIAANIYVDAVVPLGERSKIVSAINRARRRVAAFFGPLNATPRIIVCRSRTCARTFGTTGAKGVAFAWHAILLTNSRIFSVIAAHELAHIELHWHMGIGAGCAVRFRPGSMRDLPLLFQTTRALCVMPHLRLCAML